MSNALRAYPSEAFTHDLLNHIIISVKIYQGMKIRLHKKQSAPDSGLCCGASGIWEIDIQDILFVRL